MKLPIPSTVRFVWRVRIDCYGSMSNVQKHSETVLMHDTRQALGGIAIKGGRFGMLIGIKVGTALEG